MPTDKKISNLIENQLPFHVRDDGPVFAAFLKSYYEWMEQANNAIEVSKNLLNYQDIDNTYDKYLEYFHREILDSIPRATLTDRKKLAKHIKDVYRARGSESSYRLLFRILYNEEIEFYYPGEDILRASDGRWVLESSVRVSAPRAGAVSLFENKNIVGQTSGATARVDKIVQTISSGIIVDEIFLLDIIGTFQDNEKIQLEGDATVFATIISATGPLQSVSVTYGGAFHQVDDIVTYASASGSGANGSVTEVAGDSAVQWYLDDGGSGYTLGAQIVITGGTGTGTSFTIDALSNTEILNINQDLIEPMASVVINTGPTFVSLGANTASVSANLAIANVSTPLNAALNFQNTTVGTISSITTTNYGTGYSTVPSATITEPLVASLLLPDGSGGSKGLNAVVHANNVPGYIVSASVVNFGADFSRYDPVTITNITRSGTADALANPNVSGVVNYSGKYIDTKGWLSYNNKLQDNFYYQEFSYEIESNQSTNTYRKLVQDILHPAGTKMFGRIESFTDVDITIPTIDYESSVTDRIQLDLETIATTPVATMNTHTRLLTLGTGGMDVTNGSFNVTGNNSSTFTTELAGNTAILIVGATANGMYFANTISNNTVMTLHTAYEQSTTTNAVFYYVSNTSA